jgi:hypothetical protein
VGEDSEDAGQDHITIGALFEVALAEWSLPPAYIFRRMTLSQLNLLVGKRNERIERQNRGPEDDEKQLMPNEELMQAQRARYEVWKSMQHKTG